MLHVERSPRPGPVELRPAILERASQCTSTAVDDDVLVVNHQSRMTHPGKSVETGPLGRIEVHCERLDQCSERPVVDGSTRLEIADVGPPHEVQIGTDMQAVRSPLEHTVEYRPQVLRPVLEAACRALDRVLLWGFYEVPHFTDNGYRIAYWDKFSWPETLPTESPDFFSWWVDEEKLASLQSKRAGTQ